MYLATVSKYTYPQKDDENGKQYSTSVTFVSNTPKIPSLLCIVGYFIFPMLRNQKTLRLSG